MERIAENYKKMKGEEMDPQKAVLTAEQEMEIMEEEHLRTKRPLFKIIGNFLDNTDLSQEDIENKGEWANEKPGLNFPNLFHGEISKEFEERSVPIPKKVVTVNKETKFAEIEKKITQELKQQNNEPPVIVEKIVKKSELKENSEIFTPDL